jgi:hypothetical protein
MRHRALLRLSTAALLAALLGVGCTHSYVVRQVSTGGRVGEFRVPNAVELRNAQDDSQEVLLGQQGIHKYVADLRAWTDIAIATMQADLSERGMPASPSPARSLELAVTRATFYAGFANIRCIVMLDVETGDGFRASYEGNAASGMTLYKACDVAVARAVALALSHPRVLVYLTD